MFTNKPQVSGAEMMLRSFGMGEVLDMAKSLANDGTFQKILEFADKADQMLVTMKRIEEKLDALAGRERLSGNEVESCTSAANGGFVAPTSGHVFGLSEPS